MDILSYLLLLHVYVVTVQGAGLKNIFESRGNKKIAGDTLSDPADPFKACIPHRGEYGLALSSGDDPYHKCMYYQCMRGNWIPKMCPDGRGIREQIFHPKSGLSKQFPCVETVNACKATYSEKGVADTSTSVCGVDVCWIVDMSCSISSEDKARVKKFVSTVTRKFPLGPAFSQISGSTYGDTTEPFIYLNSYNNPRKVREAIMNMATNLKPCATKTYLALREAREVHLTEEKGRRPDRSAVCIVMTDGMTHPPTMKSETIAEADKLRKLCTILLIILPNTSENRGISIKEKTRLRLEEFAKIQPDPSLRLDLRSFEELDSVVNEISKKTCFKVSHNVVS
ncbi:unnamed protein product [Owenia fusiformis]|uniref:VWFA domain-containing protein n=1 Tax=Owenia fusiformis TaxID=6347 RepID=A0A8S4N1X1_OWEFU|nr:unnamed protein product [Owenia fusiformis]